MVVYRSAGAGRYCFPGACEQAYLGADAGGLTAWECRPYSASQDLISGCRRGIVARKLRLYVASISMVLVVAPAAVGWAGARTTLAGACRSWKRTPSPSPGTGDNLSGVAAISASNAWTVGDYFVGVNTVSLIEHWNAKSWRVCSSPDIGT